MKKIIMTDIFAGLTFIQAGIDRFSVSHNYGVFSGDLEACLKFWDKLETSDADMAYQLHLKKTVNAA